MSRNLVAAGADAWTDGSGQGRQGRVLVQLKKTNSVRDVRGVFLALAYLLHDEPASSRAVCVLTGSRLTRDRVQDELDRFRALVRPAIADRVHFLIDRGDPRRNIVAFDGSLVDAPSEFLQWLERQLATERLQERAPQLPARQAVVAVLAQLRLWNQPPVTVKRLQETCGVSYPTVAGVLKALAGKGWLEASDERGVRLRPLVAGEWLDQARDHARERKTYLFNDPTGQGSPEQMIKRLARLQAAGKLPCSVRIGGVIGASGHFPALDITAAPRLDLAIDGDPVEVATLLDAGLLALSRPEQRVALAVHITRYQRMTVDSALRPPETWAGELECLADLVEMGYAKEATEMAQHMALTTQQAGPAP